jgi:hypothetical protein
VATQWKALRRTLLPVPRRPEPHRHSGCWSGLGGPAVQERPAASLTLAHWHPDRPPSPRRRASSGCKGGLDSMKHTRSPALRTLALRSSLDDRTARPCSSRRLEAPEAWQKELGTEEVLMIFREACPVLSSFLLHLSLLTGRSNQFPSQQRGNSQGLYFSVCQCSS